MFLPISFVLGMIPTFHGMSTKAITRLFNVIMARTGITLIITVAFSISTMLYKLSATSPFFIIDAIPKKSSYEPKVLDQDGTVDISKTTEITDFLNTFFKLYPTATEKELE